MNKLWLVGLTLCSGTALAQDSDLGFTVAARAWYTDWGTFAYTPEIDQLTQMEAESEWALTVGASVRYGKFIGSLSALLSTDFTFAIDTAERKELDVNFGYAVTPALTVTLGYKEIERQVSTAKYRPAGPVIGVSVFAPVGGLLSVYGSLGIGRLQTPSGGTFDFKSDYRLSEFGLAYTPAAEGPLGRFTFTGGYRIQLLKLKDALGSQDARDTTQGFTLGALATF